MPYPDARAHPGLSNQWIGIRVRHSKYYLVKIGANINKKKT